MSAQTSQIRAEHRVELPPTVLEAIADELGKRDAPDERDVVDLAHDHVEQSVEFVTEDGRPIGDAVLDDRL